MPIVDLTDWLEEFGQPGFVWYAKRLSGNDTLANGSHQAGPYVPKEFLFSIFPSLEGQNARNPDVRFDAYVDSHADHKKARAVWYNNRLRGGTRNEARLTNFGGRASALLDPEATGALAIFAFAPIRGNDAEKCHIWVCRSAVEEDLVEERIGIVEPGNLVIWSADEGAIGGLFASPKRYARQDCRLTADEIPVGWLDEFPSGEEIIQKAAEMKDCRTLDPDERLLRRRQCEFEIFLSVEEAIELPVIKTGFTSINAFIASAQRVLQRRKARSGRSLELHARAILLEEGFVQGVAFDHQPASESGKSPDFLFPTARAYADPAFPAERLRMLAVKTTFRDRWSQILEEADRIRIKHLLTIQEGVSLQQFQHITEAGVRLVVPARLHSAYREEIRPHLISLESFIAEMRLLQAARD